MTLSCMNPYIFTSTKATPMPSIHRKLIKAHRKEAIYFDLFLIFDSWAPLERHGSNNGINPIENSLGLGQVQTLIRPRTVKFNRYWVWVRILESIILLEFRPDYI